MSKGEYAIPFDSKGNQQHYPEEWCGGIEWRDNAEFDDTLTYAGYSRGRSAAYFQFKRADGTSVTMFLTDFEDVVPLMVNGKVSGRFTFVKRGQNYGVRLV